MNPLHLLAAASLALLGGCGLMPQDISGTRKQVESSHVIRVGLVQGNLSTADRARAGAFLGLLGRATGARPNLVTGAAEPLLIRLQEGQLDIVIGEIAPDSPWIDDLAVIEPLTERQLAGRTIGLSAVARNGENRWIMLLEKTVRDLRSGA